MKHGAAGNKEISQTMPMEFDDALFQTVVQKTVAGNYGYVAILTVLVYDTGKCPVCSHMCDTLTCAMH